MYIVYLRETKIVRVPDTLELLQMSFLLGGLASGRELFNSWGV